MWLVSLGNALLACVVAGWWRTLLRARGDEIPCTARQASPLVVIVSTSVLVADLLINVVLLEQMRVFGPELDGLAFAVWLGSVAASAILFGVALATWWTNRDAQVWIRVVEPGALVVREPSAETRISLGPASVRAYVVGNGAAGPMFVQYVVEHERRSLNLVVPFTLAAAEATHRGPWLAQYTGPIAQAQARRLNRFLAPYCARHPQ